MIMDRYRPIAVGIKHSVVLWQRATERRSFDESGNFAATGGCRLIKPSDEMRR
jgi:hypothetical protein